MDDVLDRLRHLAATNPKAARELFVSLLDTSDPALEHLLERLSAPDEGRLRHLVATAVRRRTDRDKVVPRLISWLEHETDEFAKAAINGALEGIDFSRGRAAPPTDLPKLVETYRYIAERLCHKVRNALPGPATHLRRIEDLARDAGGSSGAELLTAAARLRESLRVVSRLVEFDTDDAFFQWRPVQLLPWLDAAGRRYVERNEPIAITCERDPGHEYAIIRANDFLLETIFWNLWKNAHQAVEGHCGVVMTVGVAQRQATILITDNGPGLPPALAGLAFEDRISTHGNGRGRGLLEVADAVRRLSGEVKVVNLERDGYRVRMNFPLGDP